MNETKKCPVCNKIMNYNLVGKKKNEKAPDWKCSDPGCKFSYNKITGKYEPGEFITSVWDNKTPRQMASTKFDAELRQDGKDSKIEKMFNEKQDNIKWLNALNNACLLVAHDKNNNKTLEELANELYKLQPISEVTYYNASTSEIL